MAIKGRKPKPTKLHILDGNPSKLDLDEKIKHEPKPIPIAPECPKWLKPLAKKIWKKFYPELENLGLLTIIDEMAFAGLCQNYAIYIETERFLKKNGRTYKTRRGKIKTRPEVYISNNALNFVKSFATEFGLTPSSRGRIILPSGTLDDEFERLLD
jgi:P27 family predicted phage terminase small subunit